MEINNLMTQGKEVEEKELYKAFYVNDQSINKLIANVHFHDDEVYLLGKVAVDQRLRPFSVFFSKSIYIQRKFVEIIVSKDPYFSDETKLTKLALTEPTRGKGYRFDLKFEPKFDKAIFFKFMLIENEKDVKIIREEQRFLKVFFAFGPDNFTVEIKRKKQAEIQKKLKQAHA